MDNEILTSYNFLACYEVSLLSFLKTILKSENYSLLMDCTRRQQSGFSLWAVVLQTPDI